MSTRHARTFFAYGDLLISRSALAPRSNASGSKLGPLGSFSPLSSHKAALQTPVLAAAAASPICLAREATERSITTGAAGKRVTHQFLTLNDRRRNFARCLSPASISRGRKVTKRGFPHQNALIYLAPAIERHDYLTWTLCSQQNTSVVDTITISVGVCVGGPTDTGSTELFSGRAP